MARVLRIDELETIRTAGVNWRPIRRELGITGFGINAYTADEGEQLIEDHDETGIGSGGDQELYVVLTGGATFTLDDETVDAPAGTLVFVPEIASRRAAVASANATTVLAIGGKPGSITPSPWEHYFAASQAVSAGDPQTAYATAAAGLGDHPDNASLHYNLACFASLAGDTGRAIDHLIKASQLDPSTRQWAADDHDLDAIRSDPRFPG
jgi:hypothetical protein